MKRLAGAAGPLGRGDGRRGPRTCRDQGAATGRDAAGDRLQRRPRPGARRRPSGSAIDVGEPLVRRRSEAGLALRDAFAAALAREGVAPTAKHFPGLGAAPVNTDEAVQRIDLSAATLRRVDEQPYRRFVARRRRGPAGDALQRDLLGVRRAPGGARRASSPPTSCAGGSASAASRSPTRSRPRLDRRARRPDRVRPPRRAGRRRPAAVHELRRRRPTRVPSLRQQLRGPRSRERFARRGERVLALRARRLPS